MTKSHGRRENSKKCLNESESSKCQTSELVVQNSRRSRSAIRSVPEGRQAKKEESRLEAESATHYAPHKRGKSGEGGVRERDRVAGGGLNAKIGKVEGGDRNEGGGE